MRKIPKVTMAADRSVLQEKFGAPGIKRMPRPVTAMSQNR